MKLLTPYDMDTVSRVYNLYTELKTYLCGHIDGGSNFFLPRMRY